jgi:hypothetical protein
MAYRYESRPILMQAIAGLAPTAKLWVLRAPGGPQTICRGGSPRLTTLAATYYNLGSFIGESESRCTGDRAHKKQCC